MHSLAKWALTEIIVLKTAIRLLFDSNFFEIQVFLADQFAGCNIHPAE